jgi:superfamily II DNA/RNA helicase
MLDMGFIPDIERIFKLTPPKKQTLFFSATMPPEITRLTKQFLNDPTRIEASRPATTNENIAQFLVRIPLSEPAAKRMTLRELVSRADVKNGIVFCNRKSEVDVVAKSLRTHGFDAAAIHGDLDQSTRTRTLESFRKGELRLLVASDVAARGLDIPDVSHVFNYDVPHHADDYVHRIGRTGRAGKTGETFMIVTPADARSLDKVLKLIGKTPGELALELDWDEARARGERQRKTLGDRGGGGRRGERASGRAYHPDRARSPSAEAPSTPSAPRR